MTSLILRHKPKHCLEIGVAAGGSSAIICNALQEHGGELSSVDYNNYWYWQGLPHDTQPERIDIVTKRVSKLLSPNKLLPVGWVMDHYPDLKKNWTCYSGGLIVDFIEEICKKGSIDLCFLDAAHVLPGEILDFLIILPYLTDDAVIIIHDIHIYSHLSLMSKASDVGAYLCNTMLFSALRGTYYLDALWQDSDVFLKRRDSFFSGIGAIKISKQECIKNVYSLFNLLVYHWVNIPTKAEEDIILNYISRHYDIFYVKFLKNIFSYQRLLYKNNYATALHNAKSLLKSADGYGMLEFLNSDKLKVLYGAGNLGRDCLSILFYKYRLDLHAMIYDQPDKAITTCDFLGKFYHVDDFPDDKNECAVLVCVNEKHNAEITSFLHKKGFMHIYTVNNWHNVLDILKTATSM
jgi:hypothetical protein